jgi:signal transduction histidine kinase
MVESIRDYGLVVAAPIHVERGIIGVVGAIINWSEIINLVNTVPILEEVGQSEAAYVMLIDAKGLALTQPYFESQKMILTQNLKEAGLRSARLVTEGQSGFVIERGLYGADKLIGFAPSQGYRDYPGLGWAVLDFQRTTEAFEPIRVLRFYVFLFSFVLVILVTLIVLAVARRITRPIETLTRTTERIGGRGDLTQQIDIHSRDELGVLASSFNKMIRDLKQSRDELLALARELEKAMALKDELVAKVSHELRTPLTSVKEGVNLIRENALGATTAEQQDFLSTMDKDLDRLTELINNMLDISKIEAGRMRLRRRRADLRSLVEDVIRSYRPILGHRTVTTEYRDCPPAFADPEQIPQVLGNLVSNAVKFTRDDGAIRMGIGQERDEALVFVEDNGIGIKPEDLPKLFQKFSQVGDYDPNQPRGTGLGLVICRELVELHNGRIEVASELGRGTRFTVRLPLYTDALALTKGCQELRGLALQREGQAVGLIAISVEATVTPGVGQAGRQQEVERLANDLSTRVHKEDIVLDMEPHWIVILVVTDPKGLRAMVRRLRGTLPQGEGLRFGVALLVPTDTTDPLSAFEYATKTLDQGLAAIEAINGETAQRPESQG